jgi:Flp pilus assembly protein TadG
MVIRFLRVLRGSFADLACQRQKKRVAGPLPGSDFFEESGVAAIEFAFLAPALFLLITGVCQVSMLLSNYETLENAAHAGARQLAISRGDPTPVTDTETALYAAAGNLTQANITISFAVNGTACSADATCAGALSAGAPSTVKATYPCNLVIMGTNFAPSCNLSVSTSERTE